MTHTLFGKLKVIDVSFFIKPWLSKAPLPPPTTKFILYLRSCTLPGDFLKAMDELQSSSKVPPMPCGSQFFKFI